jgi:hypothetical protein
MTLDIDHFWARVDRSDGPDACWLWTGSKHKQGYGHFRVGGRAGRTYRANRWILGHLRGEHLRWDAEVRETANHHCDNAVCVNPAHLYIGTQQQNVSDAVARGLHRGSATHCPKGHPYDEANTRLTANGRECRACRKKPGSGPAMSAKTHCPSGHPYDDANTRITPQGHRKCRECNRIRVRAHKARLRESRNNRAPGLSGT